MHARERHRATLRLLAERGFVSVQQLRQALASSEATVRRDLSELEAAGQLRRIRGGAEPRGASRAPLAGQPEFFAAHDRHLREKRAIARAAVARIRPGESIIIDAGTTAFAMVEFLRDLEVRVLTPSFPVAEQLLRITRSEVLVPGGSLYRDQQLILSPFDEPVTAAYWATQAFLGAQGVTPRGLMQSDPLLVQAQRRLLERAERVVVLADASKFASLGSLALCPLDRIDCVITDDRASAEAVAMLEDAGVEVILASPAKRTRRA